MMVERTWINGKTEIVIDILGSQYTIKRQNQIENATLRTADGYCDDTLKLIVVSNDDATDADSKGDMDAVRKKQLRHEIIHAFLFESGLAENSDWAQNEEVIDWIAIQFPKLARAFEEAEC